MTSMTSCAIDLVSDVQDVVILVPGVDWPRLQADKPPDWDQLLDHHEAALSPHEAQQPQQTLLPQV